MNTYILAIESSCDETSMAIVKNGHECLSIVINTQIKTHENYGGVVPEIASRMHTENITKVLDETLAKANMKIDEIDAIASAVAKLEKKPVLSLSPGPAPVENVRDLMSVSNMWRISEDFWDNWESLKRQFPLCRKWQKEIN